MGDFKKHLRIAREKLSALMDAFDKKKFTVVGDLATKVCEQLVEAEAAREGKHFGTHLDRHSYSNARFPKEVNEAMRKVWFAYGDLGYDGVNGKRAKAVMDRLHIILDYFGREFGEKIEENI
jgi:hypothetical protein